MWGLEEGLIARALVQGSSVSSVLGDFLWAFNMILAESVLSVSMSYAIPHTQCEESQPALKRPRRELPTNKGTTLA